MWSKDYYYPNFRDEKTEATPQESIRNGIKNPDSLAPEHKVLTNLLSISLSVQGVFTRVCADRGPIGVQKLGSHETAEFDR